MKSLFLADYFEPNRGGAIEIARLQAQALARQGNQVDVLTSGAKKTAGAGDLRVFTYPLSYNVKLRNYLGLYHPKAVKILKEYLATFPKPDVCYIHNIHTNWSYACLKVLHEAKVRSVITFHDVVAVTPYVKFCNIRYQRQGQDYIFDYHYNWIRHLREAKFFYNPVRNLLIKKYLKFASERYAVSQALADFLKTNGIPVDAIKHNKLPKGGNPSGIYQNSILFGGRLSSAKGSMYAIKYLARLKSDYGLAPELRVAGRRGLVTQKMERLAVDLGVSDQVKFLGWLKREAYEQVLKDCGVVIVPSICFDSLPTVILEAMRQARPVVVTIFGGAREMVEEAKTGYVRDPRNTDEFTEAIAKILGDKKLAGCLGLAGFERFKKKFAL